MDIRHLNLALAFPLLVLAACGQTPAEAPEDDPPVEAPAAAHEETATLPALIPPGPGEEGGLPDDRTPIAEGPFAPDSAQGAAQVVQRYAAFMEERRFADAWGLWAENGQASAETEEEFAAEWADYTEIHALVGAPDEPEGAAGSVYVTVPLQLYGRMADGSTYNYIGPVTLRRVNDVPGASERQLRWQISNAALVARGTVREAAAGDGAPSR